LISESSSKPQWNDGDLNTIRSLENFDGLELVFQRVLASAFGAQKPTPVHFDGKLIFNDDYNTHDHNNDNDNKNNINKLYEYDIDMEDIMIKVLMDTGALCANYVSKHLVDDIRTTLLEENNIIKQRTRISLADDSKRVTSEEKVILTIQIIGKTTKQMYKGEFIVLNMGENDVIIGLPAILEELWDFFKGELEFTRHTKRQSGISLLALDMTKEYDGELTQPWQFRSGEEAPEEQEVPLPAQFEFASSFLGKSREEAVQEYKDMFDEHIDPEFRANTSVEALLLGKGLKVFVPNNWEGIKGIEPLRIEFSPELPKVMKPRSRPINPRLYDTAYKEFKRLLGYFYEESRSPVASPLVIAPKATKPFIRFCGDYSPINKYIPTGHYTIPIIRHELDTIIGYKLFLDIDLTNAYHQISLHPETSAYLSVQTPWGQFQPKFMPEGIGPGSSILQETVRKIFGSFEWAIVIFDNVLILAHDYQDAFVKLETFLDKCIEHNVILKFAKTWLGFKKVKFFGYECTHNTLKLTDDRKQAIMEIPFPATGNKCKKVRSLLGCGVMFTPFVANYSELVANLTDMTKASFNWDETTWKHNYRQQFLNFKEGLLKACAVFYPDYSLQWILRTDASEYGIGAVLIQVSVKSDGINELQPIAFYSKKFSEQALKWPTIEQEGYAIFAAVRRFSYYLIGKDFIIETDHNNLRWMEASEVAKIVRWRIYLQGFTFLIRHIKGTLNTVADALSRLLLLSHYLDKDTSISDEEASSFLFHILGSHFDYDDETELAAVFDTISVPTDKTDTIISFNMTFDEIFSQVHSSTAGHWGLRETWKRMNTDFPGHGASMNQIAELIACCPTCQKTRKERRERLIPVVRHLKPPHSRTAIGIDALAVTPHGRNGETYIILIVNLFTKLVSLNPTTGCSALNLAHTVWKYWCTYGFTDMVISDKGPDLTSQLFAELVRLMGMRHVFSIADKHVNGSERLIKEAQRHLRAIVYDTRVKDVFDDVTIIPSVQSIMNSKVSTETNHTPFELTFGSQDTLYSSLLRKASSIDDVEITHVLLQRLNSNLRVLRAASSAYQSGLIEDRLQRNRNTPQNQFQKGDYVTYDAGRPMPKLSCRYKGPYSVEAQYKNDVTCRNLITDALVQFSVSDLEPFFCDTADQAYEAALRDQDQFRVRAVLSYTGDSRTRTTMTFVVEFEDGDIVTLPWTKDLECEAYFTFCLTLPHLYHLTLDTRMAKQFQQQVRKEPITTVNIGDIAFIDLRFFGDLWYEALQLPDAATTSYVFRFVYTHWYHKTSHKKISGYMELDQRVTYALDGYAVYCWGTRLTWDPVHMVLVDAQLVTRYPQIMA
jgi:hypothetical protein